MSGTRTDATMLTDAPGVMVGIDLVEVERIAQTVERFGQRFLERVFTQEELREGRRRITWLAGRFAAKEACAKALGTGVGAAVAWRDMQVLRQPSGKRLTVFALAGDLDATAIVSNTFTVEWPRGSGRMREYPEIDRAAWFGLDDARRAAVRGQVPFLDRLSGLLAGTAG